MSNERDSDKALISSLRAEVGELREAAEAVTWFDWSANDSDAVAAVDKLRSILQARTAADGGGV